jgi:hypothetical protein
LLLGARLYSRKFITTKPYKMYASAPPHFPLSVQNLDRGPVRTLRGVCTNGEVFDDEPFQQHLNVRRLTLSKETLGYIFKVFMEGDRSFNSPQTPIMQVAVFCEIMQWCVPDCSSVLELQVTMGSKDEVPILEGVLAQWKMLVLNERLKQGKTTEIPKTKKKLMGSLVKTAKELFGDACLNATYPRRRINGKRCNETCYKVNPVWRDRQMELFKYSAHTQREKLDREKAHRYGLFCTPDFSNPNKAANEHIQDPKDGDLNTLDSDCENLSEGGSRSVDQVCESMDRSKTQADALEEQRRCESWAALAQQTPARVCAPAKDQPVVQALDPWSVPRRVAVVNSSPTLHASGPKRPKRTQVNEKDRVEKLRKGYRSVGLKPNL